jgi:two-component system LytT family response regulator
MESIKCVVVDDENKVLQALIFTIKNNFPQLEIVGCASSVDEAYSIICAQNPQVVFLDIVMPEKSGFELIKMFDHITFEIVFITSHQEFALEAIRNLALAYILKPVDTIELQKVIEIIKERIETKQKKELYDALLHNMSKDNLKDHKLAIYNKDRTELIDIRDITRLEGWNRYTKIFTKSGKVLISSYNLGRYADLLSQHSFYLCHKSHLINLDYAIAIHQDGNIILSDQSKVPLSIRKHAECVAIFRKVGKKID